MNSVTFFTFVIVASYCFIDGCTSQDPCEMTGCPLGLGCYLEEDCSILPCTIVPVCRNPCEGVMCAPDEFCYSEDVICIKAPCNPIPVCRNPCDDITCNIGEKCVLEAAMCIRTPCNPIATCQPCPI